MKTVSDVLPAHGPVPAVPLLSAAYFPPVQWFVHLNRSGQAWVDGHEHFVKQTFRNRCVIASPQGPLALTVPVEAPLGDRLSHTAMRDVRISNHGKWRTEHWNALATAYGESPFFEYYADDLRPFFERQWTFLFDFNMDIVECICRLLDICPTLHTTTRYVPPEEQGPATHATPDVLDLRAVIRPKHAPADPLFVPRPYYQVYAQEQGFCPNLSVLDLLFCQGNEAVLWL